ncbi:DUF2946 family protein [Hydrocarboniphaga sp.]|uniref:DUF2946 family protein n=1 Tax=Hydrocarboniphaga sp. TaxID=2033016 RepID=UPI003D0B828A
MTIRLPLQQHVRAIGLWWLLFGWIAQLLLPVVHQGWMASRSRDANAAAFCGLASTRLVAGFSALAPPELKAAIRRASRGSGDANCELCASVHAPAAHDGARLLLPDFQDRSLLRVTRFRASPALKPQRLNLARGPPAMRRV